MFVPAELLEGCHPSTGCHMCKSTQLAPILDLGSQPHSDDFLDAARLRDVECLYPLRLVICEECGLIQIDYYVDPRILYQTNYVYESSTTTTGTRHYAAMAHAVASRLGSDEGKKVIDIGSNVGVLLQAFKDLGFTVLGIDPAQRAAQTANDAGIRTLNEFFTADLAARIREAEGTADVITGTNVFAHIHDLADAVDGMRHLLAHDGLIVIEAPSALDLIQSIEYDTIYHQHIGYLSVLPMQRFFAGRGLELFDVEAQEIHGGTLRYFVQHKGVRPVSEHVNDFIQKEQSSGLYDTNRLLQFAADARAQRQELLGLLSDLKRDGKRIVGVSAPAKGNTLLNFCHINDGVLDYITERNVAKVGMYTPGTHIAIVHDSTLDTDAPDYALVLAWNFAPEIMKNLHEYAERGGKFIIPVPHPRIV